MMMMVSVMVEEVVRVMVMVLVKVVVLCGQIMASSAARGFAS